jgi:hypothetical protein
MAALLWWRRAGVSSKGLYSCSWINVTCYLLWLALGILQSKWRNDSLIGVLIALPLLAAGFSLVMAVWSCYAKQGERWIMAASNVFMVILWTSSLVAPN